MAVSYMRLACRLALFGELEEEKIPGKKSYRGSPAEDGGFEPRGLAPNTLSKRAP